MAALSTVSPATVATAPMTNSPAVTGSLPISLRLWPRNGDNAMVPSDRRRTTLPLTAIPVVNTTRRSVSSIVLSSANKRSGTPSAPSAHRSIAVDAAAAARPTSCASKRCVATAQ